MPRITVQTDPHGDDSRVTLSEEVSADNLASPHYAAQLVERVAWATADAEALESDTHAWKPEKESTIAPPLSRGRLARRATNRARPTPARLTPTATGHRSPTT
jgi:hypothetical protein